MMTLSNGLSLIRAPLALLFLLDNQLLRLMAIILAMITDSIDGYLARKYRSTSKFGAVLDPVMDKFFVYFVLTILLYENALPLWQAGTMLFRDLAVFIFGLYLLFSRKWKHYYCHSIKWGKVTTAMQFLVLIGLTLRYQFSPQVYLLFIVFGILAFFELLETRPVEKNPS